MCFHEKHVSGNYRSSHLTTPFPSFRGWTRSQPTQNTNISHQVTVLTYHMHAALSAHLSTQPPLLCLFLFFFISSLPCFFLSPTPLTFIPFPSHYLSFSRPSHTMRATTTAHTSPSPVDPTTLDDTESLHADACTSFTVHLLQLSFFPIFPISTLYHPTSPSHNPPYLIDRTRTACSSPPCKQSSLQCCFDVTNIQLSYCVSKSRFTPHTRTHTCTCTPNTTSIRLGFCEIECKEI